VKRITAAILCTGLLVLVAPAGAEAATACTGPAALSFQVDRSTFGSDTRQRTIDLQPAGGGSASAVKPISVMVMRNGSNRALQFADLQDQYVYQAKPGEQARFVAAYLEDKSAYGALGVALVPVPVPVTVPGSEGLPAPLNSLFPGGQLTLPLPLLSVGGVFSQDICARVLTLTVGEASAARKARTRRSL